MCKITGGGPWRAGGQAVHNLGQSELPRLLVDVSRDDYEMPVIGGIAIVENAYEETAAFRPCWPKK